MEMSTSGRPGEWGFGPIHGLLSWLTISLRALWPCELMAPLYRSMITLILAASPDAIWMASLIDFLSSSVMVASIVF